MNNRVAVLGLGIMGSGMAHRLLSSGFQVAVYSRNREKAKPLADAGAFAAASPYEAASRADVIISMVADDFASRAVWLGEKGSLAGAKAGSILVESSTLTVAWVKELAAAATQRGCDFLDAPVTGTKPHAESGQLLFLVGGKESALDKGRDVVYLGPTGSGALIKLVNNFLAAVQAVSFGEALALIEAGGLDRDKAIAILTDGVPGSPMVKRVATRVATGDFTPHFFMRLMAKDVGYAIEEGKSRGVAMPTASAALSVFKGAIETGRGEEDFTAVVKAFAH